MKPFLFPQWKNGQEIKLKPSLNNNKPPFLFCFSFLLINIFPYFFHVAWSVLHRIANVLSEIQMERSKYFYKKYLLSKPPWLSVMSGLLITKLSKNRQQLLFTKAQFMFQETSTRQAILVLVQFFVKSIFYSPHPFLFI